MLISGYHGTTETNAHKIITEGKYCISKSDKEWLGDGIYFYESFSDAFNWRTESSENRSVLLSILKIDENAYLDLDSEEGKGIWGDILEYIKQSGNIRLTGTFEENQCAVCRILWDSNPEIMILAGSFATVPSRERVLLDIRPRRREFCVRNNEPIKCTQIIDYKE